MKRHAALFLLCVLAWPSTAVAASGKVVIAQGVDPTTLDMMNQLETPASNVGRQIFDTLVERDQDLKLVPALATDSPRAIAPTVWEIPLRRGVRFHNGEEFNAESVKFSIERLIDPANKLLGMPRPNLIDHVEIVDPYTVRIHTKQPLPVLPNGLAAQQVAMYPPKAYANKDTQYISKNPIGTGPYRFVRWVKDEEIVLEANEHYWRGAARIKSVVFRPIPDDAVRVAALQNGEVDLAVNIPPNLAAIIASYPKLFLSTAPSIRTIQLMFYTHQFDSQHNLVGPYPGPTADRRVRQAIAHAINADELITRVLDGRGIRVATLLTSFHFGFDPTLKPVRRDPARTRQLLTEAGFPNGIDITLNSPQGRYVRDKEIAEAVTGQLAQNGIRTTLKTFEWVAYLSGLAYRHKAGPVWLLGWGVATLDADSVYRPLFRSGSVQANYNNAEVDRLVDEARTTMDGKKRLALYHRLGRIFIEDIPAVPLYQQVDLYGVAKRLVWKARSDEVIRVYDMALTDGK